MSTSSALHRYKTDSVTTLSPAHAVVALYDRVLLDLDRAVAAIECKNIVAAHAALVHAQDILGELHDSLNPEGWAPAAQLAELYQFVLRELVAANLEKDAARVLACRTVIAPLRDTWVEASAVVVSNPGPST
jgi:flagellar protein FliS